MKTRLEISIFILILTFSISSCKKYLNIKPLQSQTIPSTPDDLQAILDNMVAMNINSTPDLPEMAADNYYVTTQTWQALASDLSYFGEVTNYIWDKDATHLESWRAPYQSSIYYANNVLDFLSSISMDERIRNNLKGAALFYRAFAFNQLAQIYCKPYSSTADTDLGIVLRLNAIVNETSVRSTVKQTYDQIIDDLKQAADLLPEITLFPTRPNKAAAFGTLARAYLSMRDYENAGRYADSCLLRNSSLMDYNTLVPVKNPPILWSNPEVIYSNKTASFSILDKTNAKVDSLLYQMYQPNDLRKTVFFKSNIGTDSGTYSFQGGYLGKQFISDVCQTFDGIATDEMFLIRAECYARAGNATAAMDDLNVLMEKRWKNDGSWSPFTATNDMDALNKILIERRKELCFRGLRWSDLRRFNLEGANITLMRIIAGITYTLPPNDLRWVMLIPQDVINRSGIQQNQR